MIFENTKYLKLFTIGFAICNITLIIVFHQIAQNIKSDYSTPVFNIGDIIIIILGAYAAFSILLLLYDVLGKNLVMTKNNLFSYGLKSTLILAVVFYDGVILMDAVPTFFQEISGNESDVWRSIALSIITPVFALFFQKFPLKIAYRHSPIYSP